MARLNPVGVFTISPKQAATFSVQKAYVKGFKLYHLNQQGYPAVIHSQTDKVYGYMFCYEDIDHALKYLDDLEGIYLENPEYHRITTRAYPLDKAQFQEQEVWLYLYADARRLEGRAALILEGDWVNHQ
ncbi:MAG: gamma-glutamylcyclotransferase family protein [Deinococcales bacterium]